MLSSRKLLFVCCYWFLPVIVDGRSLIRLLQDDTTIFHQTALVEKANEIRTIVQQHNGRSRQLTMNTMEGGVLFPNKTLSPPEGQDDFEDGDSSTTFTEERVEEICKVIQDSFIQPNAQEADPVMCNCVGTLLGTFTISCDYLTTICTELGEVANTLTRSSSSSLGKTCGKPQLGVTLVRGNVFSATTCISEYSRGLATVQDTCVFVNACSEDDNDGDDMSFCDCTASHGGTICETCEMCPGGKALTVDCTNINVEAVATECQAVDLDLDLQDGAGQIAGFVPEFHGFCSQLEAQLDNRISCDCNNAVNGVNDNNAFEIKCQTVEDECDENDFNCGAISSSVIINSGKAKYIQSCANYQAPFGETCTTMEFCDGEEEDGVCSCQATYNGEACKSCQVCDASTLTKGVQLDCSNVYPWAVVEDCQQVLERNSYEFLPKYPTPPESEMKKRSAAAATTTRTAAMIVMGVAGAMGMLLV